MSQLQALLNDGLIRTKHVENAAIININERKVCASTSGFYVPPENAINLIYTFYNNLMQVRREGLYFKQKHYKCVRADEDSIYLKNPDGGLIAVKTNAFILIATYKVGMYPSVCVEAVEKLGKINECICVPACQCFTDWLCSHKQLQKINLTDYQNLGN
uniref:Profilin n=1 Tax=Anas zonorhyncha TaxID=75864 RepID=A0A8B9UBM4_9AVES